MMNNDSLRMALALGVAGIWGCNGISAVGNGATGSVQVALTDAPGSYEHVNVHVTSVLAHVKLEAADPDGDKSREPKDIGRPSTEATEAEESGDSYAVDGTSMTEDAKMSGWIVLAEPDRKIDLLSLQNGVTDLLGEADAPAGEYKQLRLVLSSASVVTEGTAYPLTVPSGETSGLKIKTKFTVEDGQSHDLVLDFDAAESIHSTGDGKYVLRPVVKLKSFEKKAVTTGGNADDSTGKDKKP